jgi:excisionase family DNA binding protein
MSESPRRRYASLVDAAEYLGVNERTIRRHISAGDLPAYRLGRLVRVDLDELDQALKPVPTVEAR